ncbi:MAG: histidine kinase, partial [Desulfuromonas sp.]
MQGKEQSAIRYIRDKLNQLLQVMGTLPLKPEELDDETLLSLDPIGIVSDTFQQIL